MLNWLKDSFVDDKASAKMTPEQLQGKFLMGEFKHVTAPEYTEEYAKIIQRCQPDYGFEGVAETE